MEFGMITRHYKKKVLNCPVTEAMSLEIAHPKLYV